MREILDWLGYNWTRQFSFALIVFALMWGMRGCAETISKAEVEKNRDYEQRRIEQIKAGAARTQAVFK